MKTNTKIFMVVIIIGMSMTIYFFSTLDMSQKGFYESAIENSKNQSYHGIVTKKYYSGRERVVLALGSSRLLDMDFVYENPSLYEYIQVGDTLEKKKGFLKIRIIRDKRDTIISLKFENIK